MRISPLFRPHRFFRLPALAVGLLLAVSPILWAVPPGAAHPPKKKKPAPASPAASTADAAAPAPRKFADPVLPAKPDLPAVPLIPAEGPLTRSDLIQMALQAHPDFWRFRGEVAYYLEAEAAAYDWKDPELRIGYDHEFEQDLEAPYTESRSIRTTERAFFDTSSSTYLVDDNGSGDFDTIVRGTQTQREQTRRNSQITTETVERIKPGKYETVIEETTYEVEKRQDKNKQRRSGPGRESRSEDTSEYSRRRVLSHSRELRKHPNSVYGDDSYVVQARLFIPNPWEQKANAARARAEAHVSNSRLRNELRELVYDVGRRYDELQFRFAWHKENIKLLDLTQKNLQETEIESAKLANIGVGGLYDPQAVPRARLEISKAREEVFDSNRDLAAVKEELCMLCGLADSSRIQFTNTLRLRKISEGQLDPASLTELARATRSDLMEMKARGDVERARLREVKALRKPWIEDLRVGWGRTIGDGYRDQDEFTALLSLRLPLFSLWQNKAHRQHEEAIRSFEKAEEVLGQSIVDQVTFAVRSVREASGFLTEFAQGEKLLRADLEKNYADAEAAGDRKNRIILESDEARIKGERGRLQALYHYNKAVANLELALGMPIEEAFAASGKK